MVNHHSNSNLPEYVSLFHFFQVVLKQIQEYLRVVRPDFVVFLGGPSDVSFSGCVSQFFFKRLSSHFCA